MVLKIKVERVSRGATQNEIADALGVDRQVWGRCERGAQEPEPDVAARVAVLFGKPAKELFVTVKVEPLALASVGGR